MEKRMGIEGSPESKLLQIIRNTGYNKDTTVEVATIVTPLPNMTIELKKDGITLEMEDLIITKTVGNSGLIAGDKVLIIGDDDSQMYFVIDGVM